MNLEDGNEAPCDNEPDGKEAILSVIARRAFRLSKTMKIEQSFRDLKSLLHLDHIMNQRQTLMEKMVALVLMAFSIGVWVGEGLRDEAYGPAPERATKRAGKKGRRPTKAGPHFGRKWRRYTGLFVLLKQKLDLSAERLRHVLQTARESFMQLVYHPVRTYV